MTDTAEARAETLRRWFLEAGTWTGDDYLWRNRFVETYKEHVALSARLAQAEQERDEALGVAYLMAGQKEQAEARLREYEKALKKCWDCGQTSGEIRRIVEAALGDVKHG